MAVLTTALSLLGILFLIGTCAACIYVEVTLHFLQMLRKDRE